MNELSTMLAGFSVVSAAILGFIYLFSLPDMEKTGVGKLACSVLMLTLATLQLTHVIHFIHGADLLNNRAYLLLLALVPLAFYFFARELLMQGVKPSALTAMHAIPLVLVLVVPLSIAPMIAFAVGCGYTFYLLQKVLALRAHLRRFRFERFFFALFFAMTVIAVLLGLGLPLIDHSVFYHAYAACVSIAMLLVVSALLVYPDLLSDVLLASETVYAKSKLGSVNVTDMGERLEGLMREDRLFENESLSIAQTADALGLTSHQLSELVNTQFSLSFPRYIRQHRIEAAKRLLIAEPSSSVLSISLSTGFKSQSNFYAAFREIAGQSPAAYRKEHFESVG